MDFRVMRREMLEVTDGEYEIDVVVMFTILMALKSQS